MTRIKTDAHRFCLYVRKQTFYIGSSLLNKQNVKVLGCFLRLSLAENVKGRVKDIKVKFKEV